MSELINSSNVSGIRAYIERLKTKTKKLSVRIDRMYAFID